ncbi:MAG: D-Ala-D-Ala carboxypeptidase family metallohydrolase [Parvibaculum sp.]|uniref:D-Ala-D-Ala carboxypeptidase family metallohydrolase n=1 Tax=Parvibaculum sp. TaxID=2024848 RepID=UPI0027309A76|nr:D-Ala-D-Ala carboxypeptidase family metallohydrolase [Parvibaculum sp.]MDP2150314.1 D-Ala-D-Ala carboxypeptidase family metallohydrolase [Parvibaculum sp.]
MRLSRHFTLAEAMASNKARERGIDNTPPEALIPRLAFVAETILERVRAHYGIPIVYDGGLSWYRCDALNRAIGGAPTSQHVKGEAVDIEVRGIPNIELARFVRDHLDFDQLILENWNGRDPSSGWVHVSAVAGRKMRGEVLTYRNGVKSRGLP